MDFNIRPLGKNCASSGEPLEPGKECWSVLIEVDGKLVRQDISMDAWTGPPEGAIGFWQSEIPVDPNAGKKKLDTQSLFDYFVQLSESPNTIELDYQYVLALLLLRKRRLTLEQTITIDDMPAMRLTGNGGEGPFEVLERELSDEQVTQLQHQLFGVSAEAA